MTFTQFVEHLRRRAKRLGGLSVSGAMLLITALPTCAVSASQHFGLLVISPMVGWVLIVLDIAAALSAYVVVTRRRHSISVLLYRADIVLNSDEALSSLYELHSQGKTGELEHRLCKIAAKYTGRWKQALPTRSVHVIPGVAGGIAVVVSLVLLLLPVSAEMNSVSSSPEVPQNEMETAHRVEDPTSSLVVGTSEDAPTSAAIPKRELTSELTVGDSLSEIRSGSGDEQLLRSRESDLGEMIADNREVSESISQLLEEIQQDLEQGQTGLTEQQTKQLSELISRLPSGRLREALKELLSKQEIDEKLEQAITAQKEDTGASSQDDSLEGQQGKEEYGEGDSEGEDALVLSNLQQDQEKGSEGFQQGERSPEGSTGDFSGSGSREDEFRVSEQDEFGGQDGTSGEAQSHERSPGFNRSSLLSDIGSEGEFRRFVTKGVPLEATMPEGQEGEFTIDYEQLRAIFDQRRISQELQDIVRLYFEQVTQGGS